MTLPMIEKRRIEAAVLKHVFDVLVERHGREEAEKVIGEAVSGKARKASCPAAA